MNISKPTVFLPFLPPHSSSFNQSSPVTWRKWWWMLWSMTNQNLSSYLLTMGPTYPNSWHTVVCRDSTVPFLRSVSSTNFYWRNMRKAKWPWQGSQVSSSRSPTHSSLSVKFLEFSRIFSMMHAKVSTKISDTEARRNLWVTTFHHKSDPLQFRILKVLAISWLQGWDKEGNGRKRWFLFFFF